MAQYWQDDYQYNYDRICTFNTFQPPQGSIVRNEVLTVDGSWRARK